MTKKQDDDAALTDALVQVAHEVSAAVSRVGAAHDLSLTQVRVLAILRNHEPRMADLADYLGLDRSTISGLIDRAAARGFVERVADDRDGRSSRVRLTALGRTLAAQGAAEIGTAIGRLTADLSVREHQTLQALLSRMLSG